MNIFPPIQRPSPCERPRRASGIICLLLTVILVAGLIISPRAIAGKKYLISLPPPEPPGKKAVRETSPNIKNKAKKISVYVTFLPGIVYRPHTVFYDSSASPHEMTGDRAPGERLHLDQELEITPGPAFRIEAQTEKYSSFGTLGTLYASRLLRAELDILKLSGMDIIPYEDPERGIRLPLCSEDCNPADAFIPFIPIGPAKRAGQGKTVFVTITLHFGKSQSVFDNWLPKEAVRVSASIVSADLSRLERFMAHLPTYSPAAAACLNDAAGLSFSGDCCCPSEADRAPRGFPGLTDPNVFFSAADALDGFVIENLASAFPLISEMDDQSSTIVAEPEPGGSSLETVGESLARKHQKSGAESGAGKKGGRKERTKPPTRKKGQKKKDLKDSPENTHPEKSLTKGRITVKDLRYASLEELGRLLATLPSIKTPIGAGGDKVIEVPLRELDIEALEYRIRSAARMLFSGLSDDEVFTIESDEGDIWETKLGVEGDLLKVRLTAVTHKNDSNFRTDRTIRHATQNTWARSRGAYTDTVNRSQAKESRRGLYRTQDGVPQEIILNAVGGMLQARYYEGRESIDMTDFRKLMQDAASRVAKRLATIYQEKP